MEMQLNQALSQRLDEIALRKVVGILWNQFDILSQIEVQDIDSSEDVIANLDKVVQLLKNKLATLKLPLLLQNKIKNLIKPIGLEIIKWVNFHSELLSFPHTYFEKENLDDLYFRLDRSSLSKLSWTSIGTINYKKTAEELIRAEMLDVFVLYKLACLYCLEDYIPVLWEKLPDVIRAQIHDERDQFQATQSHLDAFWTNILRGDDEISEYIATGQNVEIANFYQNAFEVAAYTRNKAATEYFYKKLTNEERNASLFETAKHVANRYSCLEDGNKLIQEKYSDVLCYLLSQMIPEKQIELLQLHAYDVLCCLLAWPWQSLFLEVYDLTKNLLSEDEYYNLLQNLYINRTFSECSRIDLFREFFEHSPENLKNCFIEEECFDGDFLLKLFETGDFEIIRCIFNNIKDVDKTRLVFCNQGYGICCRLIEARKMHLLKLFVGEAMLSTENREKLRDDLKPYVVQLMQNQSGCGILEWERLFHVSSETDSNSETSLGNENVTRNQTIDK